MALQLPIKRDIVVAEKRNYLLEFDLCDLSLPPDVSTLTAFAYPVFSSPLLFTGLIFDTAYTPYLGVPDSLGRVATIKTFAPNDPLYIRYATVSGKLFANRNDSVLLPVVAFRPQTRLPFTYSNGKLVVFIEFGPSFSRVVPQVGPMGDLQSIPWTPEHWRNYNDELHPSNSPFRYKYFISQGSGQSGTYMAIAQGNIDITIDVKNIATETPQQFSVCSVKVT